MEENKDEAVCLTGNPEGKSKLYQTTWLSTDSLYILMGLLVSQQHEVICKGIYERYMLWERV